MAETPTVILLLGTLSVCAMVLTVTALVAAWRARRTLGRLEAFLDAWSGVATKTRDAASRVASVADAACTVAEGMLEGLSRLKTKTVTFLWGHHGNGAGGGPRRRPGATTGQGRRKA